MKRWIFGTPVNTLIPSIGLLLFRVTFGLFMLLGHGWGKLMSFSEKAVEFPDPLGIGNQGSMVAAIFCEVICSALVVLGLATRIVAIPLVFTMVVAAFIVHGSDPFSTKELALVYMTAIGVLFFTGAGRFSIDGIIAEE